MIDQPAVAVGQSANASCRNVTAARRERKLDSGDGAAQCSAPLAGANDWPSQQAQNAADAQPPGPGMMPGTAMRQARDRNDYAGD